LLFVQLYCKKKKKNIALIDKHMKKRGGLFRGVFRPLEIMRALPLAVFIFVCVSTCLSQNPDEFKSGAITLQTFFPTAFYSYLFAVLQLISEHAYPAEAHQITTADGYHELPRP
jgi:hypothetical protein